MACKFLHPQKGIRQPFGIADKGNQRLTIRTIGRISLLRKTG